MYSDDINKSVAEAVRKIMAGQEVTEKLHPNQQKIDVVDDEKIDAKDFAKLRAMKNKVKEEAELDEGTYSADVERAFPGGKASGVKTGPSAPKGTTTMPKDPKKAKGQPAGGVKEEVEQVEEGIEDRLEAARAKAKAAGKPMKDKAPAAKSNVRKVEGSAYGGAKQKDEPETDDDDTSMKSTKKGTFKRRYNTKTYSEMIAAYKEDGLKALLVTEEVTNDEFTAEVKTAQAKSEGKGKKAEVSKAAVQAVKNEETHTKVEVLDFNDVNGVKRSQIDLEEIDERSMTDAEMNKRETIVKSMKKGLSGFKQRYGDKAKNVMYATATKQAMKD